ncbi:MAG: hypothetical protein AVDCRST_MAG60-1440, partial [uncultured Nocardioides sp.]
WRMTSPPTSTASTHAAVPCSTACTASSW